MSRVLLTVVGMVLLGPLSSFADDKATSDDEFLKKSITCGVTAVKVSEYAVKHASNDKVKELAENVVKDHMRINEKLLEQAKGLRVAILVGLDKEQTAKFESLKKLEGKAFDKEYVKCLITGHEEAIKCFEAQAKDGSHADLKAFASETLPQLRKHLKKAQDVAEAIK